MSQSTKDSCQPPLRLNTISGKSVPEARASEPVPRTGDSETTCPVLGAPVSEPTYKAEGGDAEVEIRFRWSQEPQDQNYMIRQWNANGRPPCLREDCPNPSHPPPCDPAKRDSIRAERAKAKAERLAAKAAAPVQAPKQSLKRKAVEEIAAPVMKRQQLIRAGMTVQEANLAALVANAPNERALASAMRVFYDACASSQPLPSAPRHGNSTRESGPPSTRGNAADRGRGG